MKMDGNSEDAGGKRERDYVCVKGLSLPYHGLTLFLGRPEEISFT